MYLGINCDKYSKLNTTNIAVPDSILKNIDVVDIVFTSIGVTEITNPLISKQLAGLVEKLRMENHKISKIEAKSFDDLSNLTNLRFANNEIDGDILASG